MMVVADASVLVAELMRDRWWTFALGAQIELVVTEPQWSETDYEITRRIAYLREQGRVSADQHDLWQQNIQDMLERRLLEIIPADWYHDLETVARRRIPRDPNDWSTVAAAIALNAGILTNEHDFRGAVVRPGHSRRCATN